MNHPEVVDRLAILNTAHPRKLSQGLHHPGQLRKSWYSFFDLSELPEAVVHANHWHFFRHFLHDAHPAFMPEETDRTSRRRSSRPREFSSGAQDLAHDGLFNASSRMRPGLNSAGSASTLSGRIVSAAGRIRVTTYRPHQVG
jgi:hypothetical protein